MKTETQRLRFWLPTAFWLCHTRRAQVPNAMNPNESQPPAPANPQPDAAELRIEKIREGSVTLGQFVERVFVEVLRPNAPPDYPLFQNERFCKRVVRYCKPWPEWVLRIAAEVLAVRFPTVKKQTLFDCLRWLLFLAVEARIDQSNFESVPPAPKVDDRFMGAVAGHLLAHFIRHEPILRAAASQTPAQDKPGEPAKPDQKQSVPTLDELQQQFVPTIAGYFNDFPIGFLDFNSALAEAKANTFDKAGNVKDKHRTPIYRKILSDWVEIEGLSGPKELTDYLGPKLLNDPEFERRYDRVKHICSDFKITFQPFVK